MRGGVILSDAGLRVILVDADMRKPALHEFFDLPNAWGLADLLQSETSPADIEALRGLQQSGLPSLYVLTAGQIPLDPTILMMSPGFARLKASLCQRADLVIFDGPPVLSVRDIDVLSANVDVTVLVASQGITTQRQLRDAIAHLRQNKGVELRGIILDRVKLSRAGHTSYYYYYGRSSAEGWFERLARLGSTLFLGQGDQGLDRNDPNRLVGLSEAASLLGIRRSVARRWARQGRLPTVKNGWIRRVRRADLEALIAEQIAGGAGRGNGGTAEASGPEGADSRNHLGLSPRSALARRDREQ